MSEAEATTDDVVTVNEAISAINEAQSTIEKYDSFDAVVDSDSELVELWSAIKDLEDSIESVRKDVVEPEMEHRCDVGDDICGVNRIESHRKYIAEDPATVIGRAVNRRIDYTQFVSLNASTIANEFPEIATIGRNEYTYFR